MSETHSLKNSHEIYWCDLDKEKFLSLLFASSFVSRTCFHPLGLIKVRLQARKTGDISTLGIIRDIWHNERFPQGFYRGFPISLGSLFFEPIFTTTLEQTRTILKMTQPKSISHSQWNILTSLISSGVATLIYQTLTSKEGFICYMLGKTGLARLTNCWSTVFEVKSWSNVLCVHREEEHLRRFLDRLLITHI
ncbi:unnamed protein product [Adineta ricciae]|uniref:Uncharacterized protein n=1 Tax=Adineta ricciae TaxID=249248 RepID=A0A815JJY0_ADIRI|nr:unnamed protein product [Adineta ricciae]